CDHRLDDSAGGSPRGHDLRGRRHGRQLQLVRARRVPHAEGQARARRQGGLDPARHRRRADVLRGVLDRESGNIRRDMRLVALVLALAACKGRKDCDTYLEQLKAWGERIDDRLASQHVVVPSDTPSAPAAALEPLAPHTIVYAITNSDLVFAGTDL